VGLVASDCRDALHKIEDALGLAAFLGKDADGTLLLVRPVRPEDEELVRRFFGRVTHQDGVFGVLKVRVGVEANAAEHLARRFIERNKRHGARVMPTRSCPGFCVASRSPPLNLGRLAAAHFVSFSPAAEGCSFYQLGLFAARF
jgi:hypothetical protein